LKVLGSFPHYSSLTDKIEKNFEDFIDFFSSFCYIKIFNRKGDIYPLQVDMEKLEKFS